MITLEPYRIKYNSLDDYEEKLTEEIVEVIFENDYEKKCKELLDVMQVCSGIYCTLTDRFMLSIDPGKGFSRSKVLSILKEYGSSSIEGKAAYSKELADTCYSEFCLLLKRICIQKGETLPDLHQRLLDEHKDKLEKKIENV